MADEIKATKELAAETEYIELRPLMVKEHLLRLFNSQVQRDYLVADFTMMDGNVIVKLKRRTATR